jgi:hypothetical protein
MLGNVSHCVYARECTRGLTFNGGTHRSANWHYSAVLAANFCYVVFHILQVLADEWSVPSKPAAERRGNRGLPESYRSCECALIFVSLLLHYPLTQVSPSC